MSGKKREWTPSTLPPSLAVAEAMSADVKKWKSNFYGLLNDIRDENTDAVQGWIEEYGPEQSQHELEDWAERRESSDDEEDDDE
jgi:hypothetical protein